MYVQYIEHIMSSIFVFSTLIINEGKCTYWEKGGKTRVFASQQFATFLIDSPGIAQK